VNCAGFSEKKEWPSNSPDLNPLDCGTMMEKYDKLQPKPKMTNEFIWKRPAT